MVRVIVANGLVAVLVLWMVAASAEDWAVPAPDATGPGSLPARPTLDLSVAPDLRTAVFAAAERFDRLNTSEPDIDRLVLDLALDPRAAFSHIRDEVGSVAYTGRLRDPDAVLTAGAGNAYDKASTLAEILTRMGYDTRLVSGGSAVPVSSEMACGTRPTADSDVLQLAGLGPEVMARIATRAEASYAALRPHLAPADVEATTPERPHIWVQVREGADWVDLDPWDQGNAWGDRPAGDGQPLDTAPDPHRITVVLSVETLQDGALRQSELLNIVFKLPEAEADWITLSFGPEVEGVGGILSQALGGIQGDAAPMKAVLTVNGDPRSSRSFAAPGVPAQETGLFAGTSEVVTTALWLEVRSTGPGIPDERERRPIIDLVPPEVRSAHEGGAPVEPSAILEVTKGARFPAELESLRHIIISHGGMSRRLEAGRAVREMLALPETVRRAESGQPDPETLLWNSWLQARRVALASEELLGARPTHGGGCAVIDRPRVLIWGLANSGDGTPVHWLDWTLDMIGTAGGDNTAQAEMRLWHGAVQSALETEALMWLTMSTPDLFPLDSGPMEPLTSDAAKVAGAERGADAARGFLTLADPTTTPGYWWRLDPITGRADARATVYGNTRYLKPGSSYVNASRGGISSIGEAQQARLSADVARMGPQGFADEMARLEDIRQAERNRKRGGGNEYLTILQNVSLPVAIAAGSAVALSITAAVLYALYG